MRTDASEVYASIAKSHAILPDATSVKRSSMLGFDECGKVEA